MSAEATLPAETSAETQPAARRSMVRTLLLGGLPLVLLIAVLALMVATDAGLGDRTAPPIETLAVQKVRLPEPGLIEITVLNDGPDDIAIAQVHVDDAYWQFSVSPAKPLERLDSATVSIPYPWVEGEAHAIAIVSSLGTVFHADVPVAIESPQADRESIIRFGLVGLFVGIVPVALGLLWFPFMRQLGPTGMSFILALTIGLLLFLIVDMFGEAQEIAAGLAGSWHTPVLVPILALFAAALLVVASRSLRGRGGSSELATSYQIALGIGLHNLGEGLAIGAAFALGEAALGVFLVIGFTLHNVTEGIGVAAPLVRKPPPFRHFVLLAIVTGGPAIIGTWIGAFQDSPFWTAVFLAIGAGAIAQVIYEVGRLIARDGAKRAQPALNWVTLGGAVAGIAVMYGTALLVAA